MEKSGSEKIKAIMHLKTRENIKGGLLPITNIRAGQSTDYFESVSAKDLEELTIIFADPTDMLDQSKNQREDTSDSSVLKDPLFVDIKRMALEVSFRQKYTTQVIGALFRLAIGDPGSNAYEAQLAVAMYQNFKKNPDAYTERMN